MPNRTHILRTLAACACAVALASASAFAGPPPREVSRAIPVGPIPINPALVTGALENGLSYTLLPVEDDAAGVSLAIVLNAGSIHERPGGEGAASLASRLVFSKSAEFGLGELETSLREAGASVSRRESITSYFDRTVLTIDLIDDDADASRLALKAFAQYLGGLVFDDEVVERERAIALRDLDLTRDATTRLNETLIADLFPGSAYAEHPPSGTAGAIASVSATDIRDFAQRRYTPENATVIASGAFDADALAEDIRETFEAIHAQELAGGAPADAGADLAFANAGSCRRIGVVLTDDELHGASAYLIRFRHEPTGERTAGDLADAFARDVAHTALRQRLRREICSGVPIHQVYGGIAAVGSELLVSSIACTADPEDWMEVLGAMASAARDAASFGFTEREVEDAKTETARNFASVALDRVGDTPAEHTRQLATQAVMGSAPMLARERAELAGAIIPRLDRDRINAAYADIFDPECLASVLLVPSGADAPGEESVAGVVNACLKAPPENTRANNVRARAFEPMPEQPGRIERLELHPQTGVVSAWLGNGVRVHHARRDDTEGRVVVSLTLAGGRIDETAETRGLTQATDAFWQNPSTGAMSTCDFRDTLALSEIAPSAVVTSDAVRLTLEAPSEHAGELFESLHAMLASPSIEPRTFEAWRSQEKTRTAYARSVPQAVLNRSIGDAIYPLDDPRHRALSGAELDAIDLASVRAWLGRLCAESPIELAVVGDIPRDAALTLAARTIGALPKRDRIDERTSLPSRLLVPREHPVSIEQRAESTTPLAVALVGFRGPGILEVEANRNLDVAMRVLSARLDRELTGPDSSVALARADTYINHAYADFGLIYAYASAPPEALARATQEIEHQFAEIAFAAPSDEEVRFARRLALADLRATHADPTWWARTLSTLTYRGFTPDFVADELSALESVTPLSVREAMGTYYDSSRRVSITVTPAPPEKAPNGAR